MLRMTLRTLIPAFALLLVIGLATTGCKGKSSSGGGDKSPAKKGKVGSCDHIKTGSQCTEYGNDNFEAAGEEYLKKFCTGLKGEFKLAPCPAEKRVGSCATPEGTKVYYKIGPLQTTVAKAEKWCKEGLPKGTWTTAK